MNELIDKQELILWANNKELDINTSNYSDDVKEVHRAYMDLFRKTIRAAEPKRDLSTLIDGICIGILAAMIICFVV